MICDACGRIQEMQPESISEALEHAAEQRGFAITEKVVELHGVCSGCQTAGREPGTRL
jgi:Fur family transcriptional regulator, zinc uptake regulator